MCHEQSQLFFWVTADFQKLRTDKQLVIKIPKHGNNVTMNHCDFEIGGYEILKAILLDYVIYNFLNFLNFLRLLFVNKVLVLSFDSLW
jgi:hypothetical protein